MSEKQLSFASPYQHVETGNSATETATLVSSTRSQEGTLRKRGKQEKERIQGGVVKSAIRKFALEFRLPSFASDTEREESENGDHHRQVMMQNVRLVTIILLVVVAVVMLFHGQSVSSVFGLETPDFSTMNSCGEFFEPNKIMSLKAFSQIESVENGAVASDHPLCSELGLSILQKYGGNAVDAAVATALCLGVSNPASSGIGGGSFIMVHADAASHKAKTSHDKYKPPAFIDRREHTGDGKDTLLSDGKVIEIIDCRETAPSAATVDMFVNGTEHSSQIGGLSIAIPGELRGLELAHSRHGLLPWATVVEPAMRLAREGITVTAHLAKDISQHGTQKMKNDVSLRKMLTKDHDMKTLLQEGDLLVQRELSKTFEAVMKYGADTIYEGELSSKIVQEIKNAGGIITEEDLSNYRPTLRSPVVARDVNGFTLVGAPPPSSGGAVLIGAARFLSGYSSPLASFADGLSKHRISEASKHTFAIRMSLSDPDYNKDVVSDAVNNLVRGPYMETLRQMTRNNTTLPLSWYGGKKWAQLRDDDGRGEAEDAHEGDRIRRLEERDKHQRSLRRFGYLEDHGTTHFSIIDKDGNAVSMTSTLNLYFGSGVVSPSTGIVFNDQMDDFATPGRPDYFGLAPSEANYISPGKKPLSSMSPTMVFRQSEDTDNRLGDLFMVLGASGGPKIISAVLQVLLNYIFLGMPLFESVAHARTHDQLLYHEKAVTTFERSSLAQGQTIEVSQRTQTALSNRGHRLQAVDYMGCVQAIALDSETNTLAAVSDIRKGGKPAGY